jgi:hypothetical protein
MQLSRAGVGRRVRQGAFITVFTLLGCAAAWSQEESRGLPENELCAAFPAVNDAVRDFADVFVNASDDLDDDGLPDIASLALVRESVCNANAPILLTSSTTLAYETNLMLFDAEMDTTALERFREAIAVLMLTNATTETLIKAVIAFANPSAPLTADYVQVTCSGGVCMPAPTRNTTATGEFLDFDGVPRAADEPFAADGDLDGDGVTNLTEYNNIQAQGGTLGDFVVVATSPELDGTEPVRSSGNGCFIATAAYGTPLAEELDALRAWRDASLLTHRTGAAFADAYYRLSPPIAGMVAQSQTLSGVVRLVLWPVTWLAKLGTPGVALVASMLAYAGLVRVRATSRARRPRKGHGR